MHKFVALQCVTRALFQVGSGSEHPQQVQCHGAVLASIKA